MSGEGEAAGDAVTGGLIAATVDGAANPRSAGTRDAHSACRNCGAELTGAYCANCGQPAHVHRSLSSLGHDILHGVFHLEGKIWRTLPELFFFPGRLTRRYIDGERAKFVSPMALFLFAVFTMFATFSLTGGAFLGKTHIDPEAIRAARIQWQLAPMQETEEKIEALKAELATDVTPQRRAVIDKEIAEHRASLKVIEALQRGDLARVRELEAEIDPLGRGQTPIRAMTRMEQRLDAGLQKLGGNPDLLLYKLKTNGYKFSWALIPMSLPFMWLLFFWRREIHVYDHAVFTTYSISFMMLFLVVLSFLALAGVGATLLSILFSITAPWHMYRQLRDAYGLSRVGTWIRLCLLMFFIVIVASLFTALLFTIGVLD